MTNDLQIIREQLDRPLVLMGMMGTGKSVLGEMLAEKLGLTLYDSDSVIQERTGRTTAETFEQEGEEAFRRLEHEVVMDLLDEGVCIISSGGGVVLNVDTRSAIKERAVSVWLNVLEEELARRLEGDTDRPLLQKGDLLETLQALMVTRRPLYAQADIKLNITEENERETLVSLIKELSKHLNVV